MLSEKQLNTIKVGDVVVTGARGMHLKSCGTSVVTAVDDISIHIGDVRYSKLTGREKEGGFYPHFIKAIVSRADIAKAAFIRS